MWRRRNITFGDVLGESTPNTREKAIERYTYLKSEYDRSDFIRERSDAWKGLLVIVASAIWFAAIVIIFCLRHT